MNVLLFAAACLGTQGFAPEPVLWMKLDGSISVEGQVTPRLREGTSVVRVPGGLGYDFDGKFSGVMVRDTPALALTGSMTIACWVKLRSYVNRGPAAQIVFRGDDRGGLDPYQLTIHGDGTLHFTVHNAQNAGATVGCGIAIERWTHVVASLDSRVGQLSLWINGERVSNSALRGIRPLGPLDPAEASGVGIGNVQNDGRHNQPLNGTIADLRIYDAVVTPPEAGFGNTTWPVGRGN
jgi:hypothetical protein